jgi:hypothetical protein
MTIRRLSRRRQRLEDLLDGRRSAGDPVGSLLDLAGAPASSAETARLDTALAAFRSAGDAAHTVPITPSPRTRSLRRRTTLVGGLATATLTKVLAGVAAAAAASSIAVIAVDDRGPANHPRQSISADSAAATASSSTGRASHSPSTEASRRRDPKPASTPRHAASSPVGSGTSRPPKVPDPALTGLCTAWSKQKDLHGKPAASPAFGRLIAAAGGVDKVDAYCATLINAPSTPKPRPSPKSKPTPRPSSKSKPTPKPTPKPSKKSERTKPDHDVPPARHS